MKMIDEAGDRIRQLKNGTNLKFREDISNDIAEFQARCGMRNLRGECAHPNLTGEYGMMSWREYDDLKERGIDPGEASRIHMNKNNTSYRRRRPAVPSNEPIAKQLDMLKR